MNFAYRIKKTVRHYLAKCQTNIGLVRNLNLNVSKPNQPRVLISYVCSLFELDTTQPITRTYHFEINEMVKVFSQLEFCIDIIDSRDLSQLNKIQETQYDMIIGFGNVFYKMTQLCPKAVSVLYMTENHPDFSEKEENKRKNYYFERHHKKVKYTRSGMFYTSQHLAKLYDHIIVLGDTTPYESMYTTIHSIFPTGLINDKFSFTEEVKKHSITKKHYLWFGSSGAVHKGLDLLLDVFAQEKDFHLHICGLDSKERKFLDIPSCSNIHEYGYINIQSDEFIELIRQCTYIILPSCSEALATSIATGMLHGLIPVVMKNAGFNRLGHKAFYLEDFHIDYLNDKIHEYSSLDELCLLNLSNDIFFWSREHFSLSAYNEMFSEIMNSILLNRNVINN